MNKKTFLSIFVLLAAVSGAWAQAGDVTMTKTGDTYSGTFIMPTYDVEVITELWYRLSETGTNSADIKAKSDVFLERTLSSGAWNTFCVPFNAAIPSGWTVKELSSTSYDSQSLTLNFSDATSIVAGTPYLVQVDAEVVDPTFEGISQDWSASNPVTKDYVTFVPVLTPTTLTANDKTKVYLGGENTLYYPSKDVTVKGFRAYFVLNNGLTAGDKAAARNIVLNFGDETTGVGHTEIMEITEEADAWYTLDGRRLSSKPTQRGVYINSGKKVIIK